MSARDLASLLGVTTTNVYYWRRRLRDLEAGKKSAHGVEVPSGLVRVEVVDDAKEPIVAARRPHLEVRVTDTRTIVVPAGFDADELRKLVSALEAC